MQECGIDVDRTGFIRTGADVEAPCPKRPPLAYETNVQGVFAVGDVRYGSVKRVGAAIGEGANVVAQIHGVLEAMNEATEKVESSGATQSRSPVISTEASRREA
jgi:thioredoxin reductase (NADPH)